MDERQRFARDVAGQLCLQFGAGGQCLPQAVSVVDCSMYLGIKTGNQKSVGKRVTPFLTSSDMVMNEYSGTQQHIIGLLSWLLASLGQCSNHEKSQSIIYHSVMLIRFDAVSIRLYILPVSIVTSAGQRGRQCGSVPLLQGADCSIAIHSHLMLR